MTIGYCTDAMDIWSCPFTIGQYQDCFNDFNGVRFALALQPPACTTVDPEACGTAPPSPACAAATPCFYLW
jgi:hypothetical protein